MRILVIEDQEKLALSLKRGFEQNGYAVDAIFDGEKALKRIELNHADYDVIVLDIMLPGVDGITICKKMRDENIITPVLMLTAKDTVEDRILGLDAGADDYLVKPFSFNELLARVRSLLRRPREILPVELKVGNLTLNTTTRKVIQGKKEIEFTLKEFAILEYFMRHPNQVLNREQILTNVWDFAFDSFSNVVDVHLKNLRKKLETKNNDTIIETIHGVGYKLKA
jgi:DNA-binding response OmpR family regulator